MTLDADRRPACLHGRVGLEDDEVVIGTLNDQAKLRNLRADPRIAMSFGAPGRNAYGLDHYLVLRGPPASPKAAPPELLQRLAHVYLGPGLVFPPMPDPPAGYVIRMSVERISGIGDWH